MSNGEAFHPRELFQALARHEVEYVTVGGIAVQAHGGQRVTRDLDVAIAASRPRPRRSQDLADVEVLESSLGEDA